jgi:hypothetical protein
MAVWVGLKRQRGQRARRIVRLPDSLEHAFIGCLRERRGYRALSTPGLSESPADGAGWVSLGCVFWESLPTVAFPPESAVPDSFPALAVSADVAVSAATPLLVSLVMPGCADWLPVSLIAPVSVPAPPPVVVPASWLRSRPLQPARTMATRQAAACELHRMGDTLSSEAFPMPGAFPILHPRGERNRRGRP